MAVEEFNNDFDVEESTESQSTGTDFDSSFDVPEFEEYEELNIQDFDYSHQEQQQQEQDEQEEGIEDQDDIDFEAELDEEEDMEFDDDTIITDDPDTLKDVSDDELIKRLQERGFSVQRSDELSEEQKYQEEIKIANQRLSEIDDIIKKGDDVIMKMKLRNDIALQYKNEGKGDQINSEEFNEDVDAEFDDLMSGASYIKNSFLQNAKNGLLAYRKSIEDDMKKKQTAVNDHYEKIANENKAGLKNGLSQLYKNKRFLGQELNKKILQKVYRDVTSYKVSQRLNSDQSLIAEVALFLELKDRGLLPGSGAVSYGEGVRDAVNAINNGQSPTSSSPLANSIARNQKGRSMGDAKIDFNTYWGPEIVESQEEEKQAYVAGRIR